jgi:hypothetical protein
MMGKIIGGIFGFMIAGGPFGALLGIYLGHQFDRARSGPITGGQQQQAILFSKQCLVCSVTSLRLMVASLVMR